ncbi:MAG: hypothetical protein R3Y10_07730 [Ferrimonas sp.]
MSEFDSIGELNPSAWSDSSVLQRLHLLEQLRYQLQVQAERLAQADAQMKNCLLGDTLYGVLESQLATAIPMAQTITATIHLYETLAHGHLPAATETQEVSADEFRVGVFPHSGQDKLLASSQRGYVITEGRPTQFNPLQQSVGLVAVLGSDCESSPMEVIKALFWRNQTVVYLPHPINQSSSTVWSTIFAPLIAAQVLVMATTNDSSYSKQCSEISIDPRFDAIYCTGYSTAAPVTAAGASVPILSDCGSNNPALIVPGITPWSEAQIRHYAQQFVRQTLYNGGADCGRIQTLITSRQWPQRGEFLAALTQAFEQEPVLGSYYPSSDATWQCFADAYPVAQVFHEALPQSRRSMLISAMASDSYGTQRQVFAPILAEVTLDVAADAGEFLPAAVQYCNQKLYGSLAATIVIDEATQAQHLSQLDQCILGLHYGAVGINSLPLTMRWNPYLNWGQYASTSNLLADSQPYVGNALGFARVSKSILWDRFDSANDWFSGETSTSNALMHYALAPTWMNVWRALRHSS